MKDQKLFESKQKHSKLETTNMHLQELLDATTQKNQKLEDHAKEVDAFIHHAIVEHFKVVEKLHQAQTSEEGFQKPSETLEAQLSQSEDVREKFAIDLVASWAKCDRFRLGYRYWKAKVVRYLLFLDFETCSGLIVVQIPT